MEVRTNRAGQTLLIVPVLIAAIAAVVLGGWWYLKNRQKQDQPSPTITPRSEYIAKLKGTNWQTVQSGDSVLTDCAGWKPCEDRRERNNWAKANFSDPLWASCNSMGIEDYNKRHEYIGKVKDANWPTVKPGDPLLRDCAGWKPCQDRVNQLTVNIVPPLPPIKKTPPPPPLRVDWSTASCEKIKMTWQPEDSRLSDCDGLSPIGCSNIRKCLGIRSPDLGPGVRN